MHVLFESRDPRATDLRGLTERRLRFVLRRPSRTVPRAEVQMPDMKGPHGGADRRCQAELRTDGAGPVLRSSVSSDWRTALDNAPARAARFLMRTWRCSTDTHRLRQRLIRHDR